MATVIIPLEIGRRGFAAQIAIDALIIDVEFPGTFSAYLFARSAMAFPKKVKWNVRKKRAPRNSICQLPILHATGS